MKKILIGMVIMLVLVIGFVGCVAETEDSPPETQPVEQVQTKTVEVVNEPSAAEPEIPESTSTLGDYEVVITDAKISEDYQGNPVVVVSYDWTNNGDETKSSASAVIAQAFQDGVELESAIMMDDSYDSSNYLKDVRPGTTLNIQKAFILTDGALPVEIEVSELISWSDDIVYATFDPTTGILS